MAATNTPQPFHSPAHAVAETIRALFDRWTALNLTVDHLLGGDPRPVHRMFQTTVALSMSVQPVYTARHLCDYFHEEFDRMQADIEDGSPEQLSAEIIKVRDAALRGDYAPALRHVTSYRQQQQKRAAANGETSLAADQVRNSVQGPDAVECFDDDQDVNGDGHSHADNPHLEGACCVECRDHRNLDGHEHEHGHGPTPVCASKQAQAKAPMEVEEPLVDDDGFTQVVRGGRNGRHRHH